MNTSDDSPEWRILHGKVSTADAEAWAKEHHVECKTPQDIERVKQAIYANYSPKKTIIPGTAKIGGIKID